MASEKPVHQKSYCTPVVAASGNGAACGMPAKPPAAKVGAPKPASGKATAAKAKPAAG